MHNNQRSASNRNFGFLFAGMFASIWAYGVYKEGAWGYEVYSWLIASIVSMMLAVAAPGLLSPLNKAWMKLGDLMGKVVSPLVLGIIFFMLMTPVALVTRLFGRNELRLKKSISNSYWIDRVPPGPAGESFKNQF